MNRNRIGRIAVGAVILIAVLYSGWWALAQSGAAAPASLSEYMPAGALFYLESSDFSRQLDDWNSSPEKANWLGSASHDQFLRTRLWLKLQDVYGEFAAASGVGPDLDSLQTVAGGQSALAVYDIGKLDLLYISHLPGAKLAANALTRVQTGYQVRNASGQTYYLRSAGSRTAAFAVVRDSIIVSTQENLLVSALALMAGQNSGVTPIRRTAWFESAFNAAGIDPNSASDLRLAMDMPAVIRTPYFRSYWIQNNTADFRQYASFVTEIHRTANAIEEERALVRSIPKDVDSVAGNDAAVSELRAYVPADTGLFRLWQNPDADFAAELIRQKLLDPSSESRIQQRTAPPASGEALAGAGSDLLRRIDRPPLPVESKDVRIERLRTVLTGMPLQAVLHLESSARLNGAVLPGTQVALVLRAGSNWDAAAVRNALTSAVASYETVSELGLHWKDANAGRYTFSQWDGLNTLSVYVSGPIVVLSNSSAMMVSALDAAANTRPGAAPVTGVYLAGYNHALELQPYLDTMRMLDFESMEQPHRDPYFFSENIGSLGMALNTIRAVSVVIRDNGAVQRQSVRYEK